MSRPDVSFPVSGSLGCENWETDATHLNRKELLFPERGDEKSTSGKQKSGPVAPNSEGPRIARIYNPGPLSEQLVELLYELLAIAEPLPEDQLAPACFPARKE